ncbi:MAG: type IV toxin-antitoxin system AbiEi family antitoxin [Candidatus Auribacterota bacterium]|nr:type IV toxin-antitoxin system AbiEi family antitoxin [Candidatus Auribacterota bacterium]
MKTDQTKIQIFQDVQTAFERETGLKIDVIPEFDLHPPGPNAGIHIINGNKTMTFAVEVKPTLTLAELGITVQKIGLQKQRVLIIARYINPQMAERLKGMDIPFIDAAGNAYLNEPQLFLYIKGNKEPDKYKTIVAPRTFRPAGLKVVFAFLCNPGLEDKPYREIADKAGVALGTVGAVMRGLQKMDFLIDMGAKGRRLLNRNKLLTRWVTNYTELLRPKLILGRFRAREVDWWRNINFHNKAYLGGEVAANILTKYLKPQFATIYAHQPLGPILLQNRMKKDPEGNIEILRIFWNFRFKWNNPNLVHPILIYADLIATGDERNIETARIIYDKELPRFIGQD